ncbi:MAG: mechanosensitive ion channel, partial [Planctomycetes bacterium]|nr:mechanosensitive ion channel [Planctomycetota bacterium]
MRHFFSPWRTDPAHGARAALFLAALLACCAAQARAQEADEPALTLESIASLLAELDTLGLDEAASKTLREIYEGARRELEDAAAYASAAADFARAAAEAPALLETMRAELAKPAAEVSAEPAAGATLPQVEQLLKEAEAALANSRATADELQGEDAARRERSAQIPNDLATARARLAEVEEALAAVGAEADPRVAAARRLLLRAQRESLLREIDRNEQELASYVARADLLPARRDRALRRAAEAEKLVAAWQGVVEARRRDEADRAAEEAERRRRDAALTEVEQLKRLAEENVALADRRTGADGLTARISAADKDLNERLTLITGLRNRFQAVRDKVRAAGLTNAMSVLLRREYDDLPDAGKLSREKKARRQRISDAQFQQLELQDQRDLLFDVEASVRAILDEVDAEGRREDRADLEAAAREILADRKKRLEEVKGDYQTYENRLIDLGRTTDTLVAAAEEYRRYIAERILTVRSVAGSLLPSPRAMGQAAAWLLSPSSWSAAARHAAVHAARELQETVPALLVLLLLLAFRGRARERLLFTGTQVARIRSDAFSHTVRAALCTLLLAAPAPLLAWLFGMLLLRPAEQPDVAAALGDTLKVLAPLWLMLELLRQTLRAGGLAEAHFSWPEAARRALCAQLRWFTPLFLALTLPAWMLAQPAAEEAWNDSLGRILFCGELAALTIFLKNVLAPGGPVLRKVFPEGASSLLARLRYAWYAAAVAAPAVLLLLTAAGYDFTALVLHYFFLLSLELILVLVLVNGLLLRWLLVVRRRLALEAVRQRREAARAESGAETGIVTPPEELNIPALSAQTRELVRSSMLIAVLVGLYLIWSDIFPALSLLQRVQIWPEVRVVEAVEEGRYPVLEGGATADAAVSPAPQADAAPAAGATLVRTLTLADIGLALVILLITAIAARDLPGLLEILLLRRLPLDTGARYAAATVTRYTIAIVGLSAALGAIGIGWSKVQWLAAALTFGLAFGLQEIFANFVSGLIMLFERPVRIGDVVTVDGIDGKVTKIRMRATTITDWNNRELIVPNKEFITGKIMNWTLTDSVTRVVVPVGI